MLDRLITQLQNQQPLDWAQIPEAVRELTSETVAAETKADFLTALARKGESAEELAGFARELRGMALAPELDAETRAAEILDVCGTGGDGLNTFNISTAVSLVVASAGVAVAKHGNRAITSRSGSADVLEALGIRIDLEPAEAAGWLREHRFAFFFAPRYHPAFKHIGPARKLCAERGQRTLFNFLGPLLNPARPTAQLLGVPRPALCEPMGRVLQTLGLRRAMVVCGRVPASVIGPGAADANLDEISQFGETTIAEFYHERGFALGMLDPGQFPLQPARLADIAGGDRDANAEAIRKILAGHDRTPRRDAVLLNSAGALFVAGHSRSLIDGWEEAGRLIDEGCARAKLEELVAASKG